MPFGLCYAPATFSRLVSLVLRGLSWKSVVAFLDDVVVLGRDFDSHMVNLSDVLRRSEQYGMTLKPKKCQLLQNSVVFIGRLVSRKGDKSLLGRLLELVIGVYHCARAMFSLLLGSYISIGIILQRLHWWQSPCMILWDRQLHSDGVQSKRRHLMN